MASWASASAVINTGMAAALRHLPAGLALLLVFPFYCNTFLMAAILFTFCALFPRRLFRSTWPYVAAWIPILTLSAISLPFWYSVAFRPEALRDNVPDWLWQTVMLVFLLTAAAAVVALIVNYRRLENINERRRVRVLVAGLVLSWIVAIPFLFAFNVDPNHPNVRVFANPVFGPALAVTMYEALLGKHPFPAATLEELRRAVLGGLYKSPTERAWQEFFGRAFAVEPQKRLASPGALFAEFERAVRLDSAPAASA